MLFALITVLGFVAAHWRRGDLDLLHEWGLAGSRFGTVVTWFLLGGDLYTAYTFIAVPALMFGAGALGFFAVPYTIMVYPFVFVVFPRLWSVARQHGYITAADFVRGRHGNKWLALAVAVTGIVATMPYIALQLVGIQVVIAALGIGGAGLSGDLPLVIAFVILAAFTYTSGLRAPAAIAIVKDILIWITVIVAIVVIPLELGGYAKIFAAVPPAKLLVAGAAGPEPRALQRLCDPGLRLGAGVVSLPAFDHRRALRQQSPGDQPQRRLSAGLFVSFGVDRAARLYGARRGRRQGPQFAPLVQAIRAERLGPGVACWRCSRHGLSASPLPRSRSARWCRPRSCRSPRRICGPATSTANSCGRTAAPAQEAQMAKTVSLVIKFGALAFILGLPLQYAIQLQLLGGVWIIQTLPAVIGGLYTRWFHDRALFLGWLAGIVAGTAMAASQQFKPIYPLHFAGFTIPTYAALAALIINLIVVIVLTPIFNAAHAERGRDQTEAGHYV